MTAPDKKRKELCHFYENDLYAFAQHLNPHYMYGDIHREVFRWLSDPEASLNQLLLLPRGHLKSHCIAVWVVWSITKEPWTTIVYLSAGDDLAKVQMYAIKAMLESDEYRLLWPDMINRQESKRDKWASFAINVDHPKRKAYGTRDYTLIIKTVQGNATGLHCDKLVYDDIVVPSNAYTVAGRTEVKNAVADFSSIKNTGAITKAVGTLYHPLDIYTHFADAMLPVWNNETGEFDGEEKQWQIMQADVEDDGDGTGNFLWPRIKSPHTGTWYGFDPEVLMHKKVEYISLGHLARFFAQYYNNPNASASDRVDRGNFQYYDKRYLDQRGSHWYFNDRKLSLFAAMDLAWTDDTGASNQKSDFTAIGVIGVDEDGFIYILFLDQFRTDKYSVFYNHVMAAHLQWGFRKLRVETNSAGKLIAKEIEDKLRQNGQSLVIDGKTKGKKDGSKQERHAITLEPRYESKTIYHFRGGLCSELEEQVMQTRPKFDDLKDVVTEAIEISTTPGRNRLGIVDHSGNVQVANSRFGGRRA